MPRLMGIPVQSYATPFMEQASPSLADGAADFLTNRQRQLATRLAHYLIRPVMNRRALRGVGGEIRH